MGPIGMNIMRDYDEIPIPDPEEADSFLINQDNLPPHHKSGFVALVGRPNAGKSTLLNALIGERLAIVTGCPQTTRRRMLGILTREDFQVIFVDTPGIHKPSDHLGRTMVKVAEAALKDSDIVIVLVDSSRALTDEDRRVVRLAAKVARDKVLVALNKSDLDPGPESEKVRAWLKEQLPSASVFSISALTGQGLEELQDALKNMLPLGPRYFPEDQVADWHLRDIAAELIREQVMLQLRDELPWAVEVWIEEWVDRSEDLTFIRATLFVERESQKGMVIGKSGQMLKSIGSGARKTLEDLIGHQVFLELRVKVRKKWKDDQAFLKRLGLGF